VDDQPDRHRDEHDSANGERQYSRKVPPKSAEGGVIRSVHQQRREEEYERKLRIERHRGQAGDERACAATGEKGQSEFKCLDRMLRLTRALWLGRVMKPPSPIGHLPVEAGQVRRLAGGVIFI
jgi:hypothetical protein